MVLETYLHPLGEIYLFCNDANGNSESHFTEGKEGRNARGVARFFGSHVSRFLKPSDIRQIIAWAGRIVWKRLKLEVEREKKKKLSSVL